jgi:hypothetical protein
MGRRPVGEALVNGDQPTPWRQARERIESLEPDFVYWLATTAPDGRPHIRPILGLWLDGSFYSVISESSRKGKNVAQDPRCALAASSTVRPSLDIIVEGEASIVPDGAELRRVVAAFGTTMTWPLELRDGRVFGPHAPTAGPPPYAVFQLTPKTVYGLPGVAGMDEEDGAPFSSTRWRFS